MTQISTYILLLSIIVIVGVLFSKAPMPTALVLVITGMLLSFVPFFPHITLEPSLVLNFFLPLLLYQISSFSSWKDMRKNFSPIIFLSIGHVLFITFAIAFVMHFLLPQLGWPLCFVLGAVISPPDDVAIVAIAEKIHMPNRIVTILEGEGLLNDATALTLFRLSLIAALTHQFSMTHAITQFFIVVIGETLYGITLGFLIGELRLKIHDPILHMIVSLITPFLAYLPAAHLGGSGVLATIFTGFVIGHVYSTRFSADFRLISRATWPTIAFALQSILFILVGLDMRNILNNIAQVPYQALLTYALAIIATVIVGRFIWVFSGAYIPRFLFPKLKAHFTLLPWQSLFVVAWAGMRGGISLAAALAVPTLPFIANQLNPRDLLIFLVFWVIIATLVLQGLTLPWLLTILGIKKAGQREKYVAHIHELKARLHLAKFTLNWLKKYKTTLVNDLELKEEVRLRIKEYRLLRDQLREHIRTHNFELSHNELAEISASAALASQLIAVEKNELLSLWRQEKINHAIRNKLLDELDHYYKHSVG